MDADIIKVQLFYKTNYGLKSDLRLDEVTLMFKTSPFQPKI